MFRTDLQKVLREAIVESKRSQVEIAASAGISQPVLSDFLARKSDIYLATASKIAAAIGQFWPQQFFPRRKPNDCTICVVMAPKICGEHFCHLSWKHQKSWVWTDYIAGKGLRSSLKPNKSGANDTVTLAGIMAEITLWGPAAYWSENDAETWKKYLEMLTMGFTGKTKIAPYKINNTFGKWDDI